MPVIPSSEEPRPPPTGAPPYERSRAVTWIGLAVIGLLFLAYLFWRPLPGGNQGTRHPAAGRPAVYVELEPLTGEGNRITRADLGGKVTLLNLWGTWCGPCEEEFPYLVAIYEKFKGRGDFRYVSVSYPGDPAGLDGQGVAELRQATVEFLTRQRTDHATYYDPQGQTFRALLLLGVREAFPTTLVIDEQGVLKAVWQGYSRASMAEIERVLEELLE